jgi:hypothetical protein
MRQNRITRLSRILTLRGLSFAGLHKYLGISSFLIAYIVSTEDNMKKRIYIIGKAIDLKNRLSVYNKTAKHDVIYYKECGSEDQLKIVENMVLCKLENYREQANRDRFILPLENNISLFTDVIDNAIKFFKVE